MFKTSMDALTEGEDPVGKPKFNDIVKLLKLSVESKYSLYTYEIKFLHCNTVFDANL